MCTPGARPWIVDMCVPNMNYEPLAELLANPRILKLFHAPREDLSLIEGTLHVRVQNMRDTQHMATDRGLGHSLSYQKLLFGMTGVLQPKDLQRSNWIQRPLSDAQLHYAATDVRDLIAVYDELLREPLISRQSAQYRQQFHLQGRWRGHPRRDLAFVIQRMGSH